VDWNFIKTHMGKILVDKDFFLVRPLSHYRTNANVVILRTNPMVVIDTGTKNNPPIRNLVHLFQHYQIESSQIKYIIITHDHQDHFQNLQALQRFVSNASTICSKGDLRSIRYPFLMSPTWFEGLHYYGFKKWGLLTYGTIYAILGNFYWKTIQKVNKIDFIVEKEKTIPLGKDWIKIIPLRGHSRGHICVLDSRKNLFLGDFVPFTPWIEPSSQGVDLILESLNRLLQFSSNDVKQVIRAHGDIRRTPHQHWEIDTWDEEKKRFKFFQQTILNTLEMIPKRIKGKEASIHELTALFAPHYQKYSRLMKIIFIPPAITWGIAYALKLKSERKIFTIKKKGRFYWSA
jgi:glyoxylase-like metal-dependent hydrolase (beta-lactamase superfamily II)